MEPIYMLTRPVEESEFENPNLSWRAVGILLYASYRYDANPRITLSGLRALKPNTNESGADLQLALDELVNANLMQVVR